MYGSKRFRFRVFTAFVQALERKKKRFNSQDDRGCSTANFYGFASTGGHTKAMRPLVDAQ